MKRIVILVLLLAACPVWADTAVQTDQNRLYLDVATPTMSVTPSTGIGFWFTDDALPATATTAFEASHSLVLYALPANTKGFKINAFGGDMISGHYNDVSTGTIYVGDKIASGSFIKWEGKNPVRGVSTMKILMNGTSNGTATVTCW